MRTIPRLCIGASILALGLSIALPASAQAQRRSSGHRTSSHSHVTRTPRASVRSRHTTSTHRARSYRAPTSHARRTSSRSRPARAHVATARSRSSHNRIQRSASARRGFLRQTGYPRGRPGYVVDHVVPLACGGADSPSNMQWQTRSAARAKDRTERRGCRGGRRH